MPNIANFRPTDPPRVPPLVPPPIPPASNAQPPHPSPHSMLTKTTSALAKPPQAPPWCVPPYLPLPRCDRFPLSPHSALTKIAFALVAPQPLLPPTLPWRRGITRPLPRYLPLAHLRERFPLPPPSAFTNSNIPHRRPRSLICGGVLAVPWPRLQRQPPVPLPQTASSAGRSPRRSARTVRGDEDPRGRGAASSVAAAPTSFLPRLRPPSRRHPP